MPSFFYSTDIFGLWKNNFSRCTLSDGKVFNCSTCLIFHHTFLRFLPLGYGIIKVFALGLLHPHVGFINITPLLKGNKIFNQEAHLSALIMGKMQSKTWIYVTGK